MIRSFLVWAFTWLYMSAAALICLPWIWLTGKLEFTYAVTRLGLRFMLGLAGVRVVIQGGELLPPAVPGGAACIYMPNHQSNLDPPILLTQLPGNIAFLAKKELFSVPVLGAVLRAGGLVAVDRADRAAAQAGISRAADAVRGGRPFLIFPEGTRSPGQHLLAFKKGAFYLVEQAQAPVVPITLTGTGALMPRGQWRIRPGVVRMRIHPAVHPADWSHAADPRAAMAEAVRARILTEGDE